MLILYQLLLLLYNCLATFALLSALCVLKAN